MAVRRYWLLGDDKMKVTEELLKEKKKTDLNFSDGIILPDGDYRPISKGGASS